MFTRLLRIIRSFLGLPVSVVEGPELVLLPDISETNEPAPRTEESVDTVDMVKANLTQLEREEAKYKNDIAELTAKVRATIQSSFDEIYAAAQISPPTHGFTILKILDLLQSEYICNLSRDLKHSSLMLALEAAGVKPEDVVQDAALRENALEAYESEQQKALTELEAKKAQENKEIQAEIERRIHEMESRIQANNDEVAKEVQRFCRWQVKKQQEQQKIDDAVSYFTSEKPVSSARAAFNPAPATSKRS